MTKQYVLDADLLISSSRSYYSFEIAPAFWSQLAAKGQDRLILVDKVCHEIYTANDQLSEWLKENERAFVIKSSQDEEVIAAYSKIITAVEESAAYFASAKSAFESTAESWLCAHALAYSYVIVTQEIFEPNSKNEVTIPNICREFELEYVNLFQMMTIIGIKFET